MSESAQEPIRVLLFAGGGFGTAMQLGVAHALLVSRGKAPDLVVGVSAGAINAAALAEILQAGSAAADEERRLLAQTARFREVFSICQRAPGELLSALKPNSFQIDTQRPLEPLELPIHSQEERKERADALESSSGLMAVVNRLLDLRLPIGTAVRGLRRALGLRAAAEIPREIRLLVVLAELLHLLLLLAPNLPRLAPLVRHLLSLPISEPPQGGSAGELIFRSRALRSLARSLGDALVTALLIPLWLAAAVVVALLGPPLVAVWTLLACLMPWLGVVVSGAWRWARGRSDLMEARTASRRIARLLAGSLDFKVLAVWLRLMLWVAAWGALGLAVGGALWAAARLGGVGGETILLVRNLLLGGLLALVAFAVVLVLVSRDSLAQRFLARYRIAKSLFHHHPLRQIFVELFDRDYFATVGQGGGMDDVVARALDPARPWPKAGPGAGSQPKTIGHYRKVQPPIRVGIVAADLATGESEVLDETVSVVEALLAATAVSPIFPPQELEIRGEKHLLIDGVNIANEPTRPALKYLREHADELPPGAPAIHLYPVTSLPVSLSELSDTAAGRADDRSLLEIVRRALELQRFRDATLERRLTELYSRTIPQGHPGFVYQAAGEKYLRTWVYPIEPERPVAVDGGLLGATSDEERRRIVGEAVADGCRAAMERMIQADVAAEAGTATTTACRAAVARRLGTEAAAAGLPGSAGSGGPGVCEVCRYCALQRGGPGEERLSLRVVTRAVAGSEPTWPSRNGAPAPASATYPERPDDGRKQKVEAALRAYRESATFADSPWPRRRHGREGNERATVSLLFGGGVFRGVYQVGVVNALSEVGLVPDLVAGASVGAITAAMAARVFVEEGGGGERAEAVRRLAATYLAIDRLILTDRFADFVRTLTVRGAQSRFSLRDLDRAFRRFDDGSAARFDRVAREVMAGLERLLWISPFELLELTRAFRLQDARTVDRLLRSTFQEVLDRSGVGGEILGTEPLQLLIREHVLRGLDPTAGRDDVAVRAQLDAFLPRRGILFLATATNLDRGRLEVLGDRQLGGGDGAVSLLQGLLASSAFPGVFRPRWAWEVMPQADREDRLADGGVMDNLPFDAVAHHLVLAAKVGLVARRPEVPHLLFSASLEPEVHPLKPGAASRVSESWVRVLGRSRQLAFNQKMEIYEKAQAAVRRIYLQSVAAGERQADDLVPLDIEVVTVRPSWLCGTFAFHPMLGFRRRQQAQSIAHGCAGTLHRLATFPREQLGGWGIDAGALPSPPPAEGPWPIVSPRAARDGACWYRRDRPCPFSRVATQGSELPEITRDQLRLIHEECGRPESHRPKGG